MTSPIFLRSNLCRIDIRHENLEKDIFFLKRQNLRKIYANHLNLTSSNGGISESGLFIGDYLKLA